VSAGRARAALAVAFACAALAACGTSGLKFSTDKRVKMVAPPDRSKVHLPVQVRWRTAGLSGGSEGPYFAVFLDRAPVRPGQSLRAVADDTCNRTPGCPDAAYLRDRYVFVTKDTSVSVDAVPKKSGQRTGAADQHEATIVLVDAKGRRIGEAAYSVLFTVEGR
jgi:hypothetical protein